MNSSRNLALAYGTLKPFPTAALGPEPAESAADRLGDWGASAFLPALASLLAPPLLLPHRVQSSRGNDPDKEEDDQPVDTNPQEPMR